MSAGRCGSTSLISYLNQISNEFDILGENNGAILSILDSIRRLQTTLNLTKHKSFYQSRDIHKYNYNRYCGYEWYNDKSYVRRAIRQLKKTTRSFFNPYKQYIGYKDIVWSTEYLVECVEILEHIFDNNVLYVHLTRDISQQCDSMARAGFRTDNYHKSILETNQHISALLKTKPVSSYIHQNITYSPNFREEIYKFIVHHK